MRFARLPYNNSGGVIHVNPRLVRHVTSVSENTSVIHFGQGDSLIVDVTIEAVMAELQAALSSEPEPMPG